MLGKKAMLFVDAQNLTFGAKNFGEDRGSEYRVDAVALQEELSAQRDLIRGYWFDAFYTQEQIERAAEDGKDLSDKQGFFRFLRRNGYRVDAKPHRERDGTFVAKGDDIGLATELIAQGFNDSYEVAIVVTGDADFERPFDTCRIRARSWRWRASSPRSLATSKRLPTNIPHSTTFRMPSS